MFGFVSFQTSLHQFVLWLVHFIFSFLLCVTVIISLEILELCCKLWLWKLLLCDLCCEKYCTWTCFVHWYVV